MRSKDNAVRAYQRAVGRALPFGGRAKRETETRFRTEAAALAEELGRPLDGALLAAHFGPPERYAREQTVAMADCGALPRHRSGASAVLAALALLVLLAGILAGTFVALRRMAFENGTEISTKAVEVEKSHAELLEETGAAVLEVY